MELGERVDVITPHDNTWPGQTLNKSLAGKCWHCLFKSKKMHNKQNYYMYTCFESPIL